MPSTRVQDSWVLDVLGFDPRAPLDGIVPGLVADENISEASQGWFKDKLKGLASKLPGHTAAPAADPTSPDKSRLLRQLARLTNPPVATADQIAAFDVERAAVRAALVDDVPVADEITAASAALDTLAGLIGKARKAKVLADLSTADPVVATKARAAFARLDLLIGTATVTPDTIKAAAADTTAKRTLMNTANQAVTTAKAMPAGPAQAAALADARTKLRDATSEFEKADALEAAMIGQASLAEALSTGPLSAGSKGPLKDPAIAGKLIDAYGKNGRVADKAVATAAAAKFPAVVANNVGPMIDRSQAGFMDDNNVSFVSRSHSEKYAGFLLQSGGQMGQPLLDRLPDYLASGQQFKADAAGTTDSDSWAKLAQARSRTLAKAMIKPDGSLDTDSSAATEAIGNLLFHPDVMREPTPGLSENVLRTVGMLSAPAKKAGASAVLRGVTAPTNDAAKTLVRGSLDKASTHTPDDTDSRTAVLSAMLQSLDQGDVGSCFVTAQARRLRETRPLDVMKSFAELATKGTFTPPGQTAMPAVTNLDPNEDPLMRSYEYTAASAGARMADSAERKRLAADVSLGTDLLRDAATKGMKSDDKKVNWPLKQQKLAADVAAAFTFDYDSTADVTDANDGSSSKGRFVIKYKNGAIRTKADFQATMLEVALASLGFTAGSSEARGVERVVNSDQFAAKVCPRKDEAPWELASGGRGEAGIEALYGTKVARSSVVEQAGKPPLPEGERTRQVLAGFLNGFRGDTSAMAALDTKGPHSFIALPNHPSLASLKGADDTQTDQKIKASLLDKGTALRDTDLPADRAAALFDAALAEHMESIEDPALLQLIEAGAARHRPAAAMKPADLAQAAAAAVAACIEQRTETLTASWKAEQIAARQKVPAKKEAEYKAKVKAELEGAVATCAKGAMMKDMGAPEFVIADTNWGNEREHQFFVIAPDPTTGDPLLWIRTEPSGKLSPAGRDWIDRPWQVFK